MTEGDIRTYMTVDTDQKYQEKVEAAANMLIQMKKDIRSIKGMTVWLYQLWRSFSCV